MIAHMAIVFVQSRLKGLVGSESFVSPAGKAHELRSTQAKRNVKNMIRKNSLPSNMSNYTSLCLADPQHYCALTARLFEAINTSLQPILLSTLESIKYVTIQLKRNDETVALRKARALSRTWQRSTLSRSSSLRLLKKPCILQHQRSYGYDSFPKSFQNTR
jgi:hypothetical protein